EYFDLTYEHRQLVGPLTILKEGANHRLLPCREVAIGLGFRLRWDEDSHRLSGFLRRPSERLSADLTTGRWRCGARAGKIPPSAIATFEGRLYIDAEVLSDLFAIHFLWRADLLELECTSADPLSLTPSALLNTPTLEPTSSAPAHRTPY